MTAKPKVPLMSRPTVAEPDIADLNACVVLISMSLQSSPVVILSISDASELYRYVAVNRMLARSI